MIGRLAAGTACLLIAALAAALARDVWHADKALRDGDARAEATAVAPQTWEAAQSLPFGLAEQVLGIDDDLAYRDLVTQASALARRPARSPEQARARAPIEARLRLVEEGDPDPRRAAQAALLLGVLVYSDPEDPLRRVQTPSEKAVGHFRTAVQLEPDNDEAKRNLELMLQQERTQTPRGQSARGGGEQPAGGAAGLAPAGRGY